MPPLARTRKHGVLTTRGRLSRPGADYVFGDRKFGGNAQSIVKGRWVHHTSFLWDFQAANMTMLQHPPRMPAYRQARAHAASRAATLLMRPLLLRAVLQDRDHTEFVCRLRERWPHRDTLALRVARQLARCGYTVQDTPLAEAERALALPHLRSSTLVD